MGVAPATGVCASVWHRCLELPAGSFLMQICFWPALAVLRSAASPGWTFSGYCCLFPFCIWVAQSWTQGQMLLSPGQEDLSKEGPECRLPGLGAVESSQSRKWVLAPRAVLGVLSRLSLCVVLLLPLLFSWESRGCPLDRGTLSLAH